MSPQEFVEVRVIETGVSYLYGMADRPITVRTGIRPPVQPSRVIASQAGGGPRISRQQL